MNRLPVYWVEVPDEDDDEDFDRSLHFRLRDDWVAVDADQLILPISVLGRNGETFDGGQPGLLKQYGGEALLNDMLLDDAELERGTEWIVGHQETRGRYVHSVPTDDDDD